MSEENKKELSMAEKLVKLLEKNPSLYDFDKERTEWLDGCLADKIQYGY